MHVVGGHERKIQFARQRQDAPVDDPLLVDPLVLHLQKKVGGAENVAQTRGRLERGTRLLHLQCAGHFALQTATEADQPLGVLREQVLVNPRPVVEPFRIPGGHELDQILVPLVRLREQHQVVRLALGTRLLEPAP